jgi:hypothetical protein
MHNSMRKGRRLEQAVSGVGINIEQVERCMHPLTVVETLLSVVALQASLGESGAGMRLGPSRAALVSRVPAPPGHGRCGSGRGSLPVLRALARGTPSIGAFAATFNRV